MLAASWLSPAARISRRAARSRRRKRLEGEGWREGDRDGTHGALSQRDPRAQVARLLEEGRVRPAEESACDRQRLRARIGDGHDLWRRCRAAGLQPEVDRVRRQHGHRSEGRAREGLAVAVETPEAEVRGRDRERRSLSLAQQRNDLRASGRVVCDRQGRRPLAVPQTRAYLRLYASLMAPDIRGIKWAFVLVGVADGTLLPFIPIYLLERGLGPAAIGGVLAGMALVWLLAGLACGYLADHRFSAERIVLAGTAAAAALALTLALARDGTTLALLILALTLVRTPLTLLDAIVLRKLRSFSRTGYARIRLRMSAGWAVSAIASGAAYQVFGLRLIPFIYAPLTAVVALWIWRAVKPEAMATPIQANPVGKGVRLGGIPLAMAGFLFSVLLLGVSLAATQNFVTLQISVLGGGALLIAAAAAFQALTEIPTMGYTHVLTRHLSHRALFAFGCAIYLAVFILWALIDNALVVALLKLVVGVAFALTYVASVTIANDLAPARLRATGQALVKSTMFGLAPIVGALGGGFVYGALGPRLMFLASTVVVAAAGAIAMVAVPAATRAGEQPIVVAEAAAPATP